MRMLVAATTLLLAIAQVSAQEIPLGGRFEEVHNRFNEKATQLGVAVRMATAQCNAKSQCNFILQNDVKGHVTAVDDNQPTLETIMIFYNCKSSQTTTIAETVTVLSSLYGRPTPEDARALDELRRHLTTDRGHRAFQIADLEFLHSATTCNLVVARPRKQ